MKEHTARGRDVEALKHFRIQQRQGNHLLEFLDVLVHATNAVKGHL